MPGQAAAVIAESNLDVVPHRVGARVAFVHSLTIGLGVVEHEPEGKAAAEMPSGTEPVSAGRRDSRGGWGLLIEHQVRPFGVVEADPLVDDMPGLEAIGKVVQIDSLVFERAPQSLDEDVVHAQRPRPSIEIRTPAACKRPVDRLKPHQAHQTTSPPPADAHALAAQQMKDHLTGTVERML